MAAAFYNQLAGGGAASAGTQPDERVHPEVVAVMKEEGIDLSQATPQLLSEEVAAGAEMLVTMGCGGSCPYVPGLKREDWPLPDPKGKPLEEVRQIRDMIRERVMTLISGQKN